MKQRAIKYFAATVLLIGLIALIFSATGCKSAKPLPTQPTEKQLKRAKKEYAKFNNRVDKAVDKSERKGYDSFEVKRCAEKFPIKEHTTIKYRNIPGRIKIKDTTIYVEYNCDSAIKAELTKGKKASTGGKIKIPVNGAVHERVDTAAIEKEVRAENTALVKVLVSRAEDCESARALERNAAKLEIDREKQKRQDAEGKLNTRTWWAVGGWACSVLLILLFIAGATGRLSRIKI